MKGINKICGVVICVLLLLIVVVVPDGVFAQSSADEDQEISFVIKKIQIPPDFNADEFDYSSAIDKKFHITGTLDAIYKERIVVNDIEIQLTNKDILSGVSKGNYVGVKLDEAGQAVQIKRLQHRKK